MTPYSSLEDRNFWSPAVGKRDALAISDIWRPKWQIADGDKIATFGSCFAQHFSRALVKRSYSWIDFEPAPIGMRAADATNYNYGIFSARTGNVYTARALGQWTAWSLGKEVPGEVWEQDGRYFDPFRPSIEPNGFESSDELLASRTLTIQAFGDAIRKSNVLVFTLGLTESWINRSGGYEYAMCPGTVAGRFQEDQHQFQNAQYATVAADLKSTIAKMRKANPVLRILLTVSPVPLTATASSDHVLVASTWSKSTLRAVAGDLAQDDPLVDYFPSYEIIAAPPFGGMFYAANKRSVLPEGVDHVMEQFFSAQNGARHGRGTNSMRAIDEEDDLICEEALLDAFAPGN